MSKVKRSSKVQNNTDLNISFAYENPEGKASRKDLKPGRNSDNFDLKPNSFFAVRIETPTNSQNSKPITIQFRNGMGKRPDNRPEENSDIEVKYGDPDGPVTE